MSHQPWKFGTIEVKWAKSDQFAAAHLPTKISLLDRLPVRHSYIRNVWRILSQLWFLRFFLAAISVHFNSTSVCFQRVDHVSKAQYYNYKTQIRLKWHKRREDREPASPDDHALEPANYIEPIWNCCWCSIMGQQYIHNKYTRNETRIWDSAYVILLCQFVIDRVLLWRRETLTTNEHEQREIATEL